MKKNTFKAWIRAQTSVSPSSSLDQAILNRAEQTLKPKVSSLKAWLPVSVLVAASFVIVYLSVEMKTQKTELVLSEPIELIQEYDEIELMVEASQWTDEDWKVALEREES